MPARHGWPELRSRPFHESQLAAEPTFIRPKPCFKLVRACLERDADDTSAPQTETIFSWMAQERAQRDPEQNKSSVVLMDGQESLCNAANEYLPGDEVTEILDLLHANSYLWEAVHLFFPRGSDEAERFFKQQALRMLNGNIAGVIRSLRSRGTRRKLEGKRLQIWSGSVVTSPTMLTGWPTISVWPMVFRSPRA